MTKGHISLMKCYCLTVKCNIKDLLNSFAINILSQLTFLAINWCFIVQFSGALFNNNYGVAKLHNRIGINYHEIAKF